MSKPAIANQAWESLMRTHATMVRQFQQEQTWGCFSMREYDVLYTLAKAGKPLSLRELGANVLLSQPALSRMVDRLVERGLVERQPDPLDGRSVLLTLSPEGLRQQREVGLAHARSVARRMNAALTPEEMRTLMSLTRKITEENEDA